ncbi:uncharacterized protein BDV17DRAFT_254773 [Aspergillus undulatus]|uniref:uncharacterized protein n=1 Tax=Aspergillus undulatus TaxID=1810928 RepID=UPI003CCD9CF1
MDGRLRARDERWCQRRLLFSVRSRNLMLTAVHDVCTDSSASCSKSIVVCSEVVVLERTWLVVVLVVFCSRESVGYCTPHGQPSGHPQQLWSLSTSCMDETAPSRSRDDLPGILHDLQERSG